MNNDYLRLNSKSDDEEIVTSEFDVAQEKVEKPAEKKLTVWSILFYGRKKHGQKSGVDLPTFKGFFTVFLAISFIAVFLLFIALINKNTYNNGTQNFCYRHVLFRIKVKKQGN